MNQDQARRLLERLRLRTESRGATPGEAAASAELAERIIRRYGLDDVAGDGSHRETYELDCNRMPGWAQHLGWAICQRFRVEAKYTRQNGERAKVWFEGPEHAAGVACWLFSAVIADLNRRAETSAEKAGTVGSEKLRWKNRFRLAAAVEVNHRLNPAERIRQGLIIAGAIVQERERPRAKKIRNQRQLKRHLQEQTAYWLGALAGKELQLSTDVIGDRKAERLKLEGVV